jgi:CRISPR-associated protein Csd1
LEAESMFLGFVDEKATEAVETKKIESVLAKLRAGRPIEDFKPDLPQSVRFFVLALAPNAARLSVRFYIEDDFGVIAERYLRHLDRMRIDPPPKEEAPSIWRMLIQTAVRGKSENIQPNLAGEWMRAILTDTPYPLTLLSTLIMRLRADGEVNALRVAILKSILIKNFNMEVPVSLDPECREPGYLLGRLFAVYEQIQTAALGRNVNATIKDKFYGAASAQPRKVFRMLEAGSANHLSKIGKQKPGLRINFEKAVGAIMEAMSPERDPFPASLPDKSQALFGLGYYHQRNEFFKKTDKSASEEAA